MEKHLYFKFTGSPDGEMIMGLQAISRWIQTETDVLKEDEEGPVYTLTPVWMTETEFEKLAETENDGK